MKKSISLVLFPLLALGIFVGINAFTSSVSGDSADYSCVEEDGGESYLCTYTENAGNYNCGIGGNGNNICYDAQNQSTLRDCFPLESATPEFQGVDSDNYRCYITYSVNNVDGGYYFTKNRDGKYSCKKEQAKGKSISSYSWGNNNCVDLEYGIYYRGCSLDSSESLEDLSVFDSGEGGYFCPKLYSYMQNVEKGTYDLYEDFEDGHYYCENSTSGGNDNPAVENFNLDGNYVCYDLWDNYGFDGCYPDLVSPVHSSELLQINNLEPGYACPITYACNENSEGLYSCIESGEGNVYCKDDSYGDEDLLLDGYSEKVYSCYNSDGGKLFGTCHQYVLEEREYALDVTERGSEFGGLTCIKTYSPIVDRETGVYNFYENPDGQYFCKSASSGEEDEEDNVVATGLDDLNNNYSCLNINLPEMYNNCQQIHNTSPSLPEQFLAMPQNPLLGGYACPIAYDCSEEDDGYYCEEDLDGDVYCRLNSIPVYGGGGNTVNDIEDGQTYSCYSGYGANFIASNCSAYKSVARAADLNGEFGHFFCPIDAERFTISVGINNNRYGSLNPSSPSIEVVSGTAISINNNVITIGDDEIEAIPAPATAEYTYSFSGWINTCGNILTGNCSITANFSQTANEYAITFKDGDNVYIYTGAYGSNVVKPNWTKEGYTLSWEPSVPATMPAHDMIVTAKWTEKQSGGYSGGGGHSGGSSSDNHKDDNKPTEDKSSEDKPVVNPQSSGDNRDITSLPNNDSQDNTPTNPQENNGGNGGSNSSTSEKEPQYTQETLDAYGWAYANGLTKYSNVKDARLDEYMNRSEMAKISTIFATQFRGETPDESKREFCSQFSDLWKVEEDTKEYIIQSCELGNMGYQANGVDELQRFRPYTPVSLAETSIILSRMLWGNKYAVSENKWYQGHLWAVYEHRLIDNISKPFNNITRKDAFIMLYRLSFSKDVIRN